MKKVIILTLILVLCIGIVAYKHDKTEVPEKLNSVNLSTDYEINQALQDIKMLNANTVNVPIVIKIPSLESNKMIIDEYSKNKAIQIIKILKKNNKTVILEAFPWIDNGSKYETEYNPKDKEQFFNDWKSILSELIDEVAVPCKVDIINTASNFSKLEPYEQQWCEIIDFTKKRFKGLVTYKTSWWYTAKWDLKSKELYNKKLNNKLFSKVDFISIAAYFELSDKAENTVDELINALSCTTIYNRNQNITKEIENFHTKYKKEIFFGELGFPRKNYAASHPWDSQVSNTYNGGEQGRCFEAYRNVFENKDYIKGFSVFALGQKGHDKNFYPSSESIDVIFNWYE